MNTILIGIFVILLFIIIVQQLKIYRTNRIIQAVDSMKDIFYYCTVKPTMHYEFVSTSTDEQLGCGAREVHINNPNLIFDIVHPEDRPLLEKKMVGDIDYSKPITVRLRHNDGHYIWFEEFSTPIYKDGEFVGLMGVYRKIDEHMRKLKEIEYELVHDALTATYNRSYFETMLNYYDQQVDAEVSVAIVNIDKLGIINERLGRSTGDEFIIQIAELLKACQTKQMIISRTSGDEFTILAIDMNEAQLIQYFERVNEKLVQHQQKVFKVNIQFSFGCSHTKHSKQQMHRMYEEAHAQLIQRKRTKNERIELI